MTPLQSNPVVSVLLPILNAEATLGRAIDSIRRQTLQDWELIAVDDGSTDGTAELLRSAAATDERIRAFSRPHRGLVDTLNDAIRSARAPLLARMDADDWSHPDRLEIQLAHLDANPEVGLVGSRVVFDGDRRAAPGYAEYVDWNNGILTRDEIRLNRFVESPFAHPTVMFRRELTGLSGGYRETGWPEDYELWLRWLEAGVIMEKRPEPLVKWQDSPDRLSRNHQRYRPETFYNCKCHYLAQWLKRTVPKDRPVHLWGAGRITRKRFHSLGAAGIDLAGYIDINPRSIGQTIGGKRVHGIVDLPEPGRWFIIAGVGNRGAREGIRKELRSRSYVEGTDFIVAA